MAMTKVSNEKIAENAPTITKPVECAREMNRVRRTIQAARSIAALTSATPFPTAKVSAVPSNFVAERVGQIAGNNGIAPAQNTINEALEMLAVEKENLENLAIPLSDEINARFTANETETEKRSFLIQINQLVAEMMHLLSKLSDRERNTNDFQKKEYDIFNLHVAELTQKQGNWGAGVAIVSFFISAGSALTGDFGYKIGSALAGQLQPLSGYWTSGFAAESGKYSNKIGLISTNLNASSSKNSENSSWKSELFDALRNAQAALRDAARSNG